MSVTLTIPDLSEELHRKLTERARINQRSIEDEALCCLREAIEQDEEVLNSIPSDSWAKIERSVCETIHDRGTPLTDADFQRYREMARGRNRP
jgi:plasmid stability protein